MKYILILFFFLQFNLVSYAQWESTGGPIGDVEIEDIFRYESIEYASVKGCGLFKRDHAESTWSPISDYWFINHTLIGDHLFVNVRGGGYALNGLQYINLAEGMNFTNKINWITYDRLESTDAHIYYGHDGIIYRSNYDGSDLIEISEGIPPDEITGPSGKIQSFILTDQLLLVGNRAGVFTSSIEDIDWTNSSNGLEEGFVTEIESYEDILYCTVNSSLYKSEDNAQQWTLVHTAPSTISSMHVNSNSILIITENDGIFNSSNQGASWEPHIGENEKNIIDIIEFEGDVYFNTKSEGMYSFENEMLIDENEGLVCGFVTSMATDGEFFYVSGDGVISVKTTTSNWQDISPTDLPYNGIGSIKLIDNTIIISIRQSVEDQPFSSINTIFYSTDRGVTWNEIMNNPSLQEDLGIFKLAVNEGRLYASDMENLFYSSDLGTSWTQLLLPEGYCDHIFQMEVHNAHLYVSTCHSGILKLEDNDEWVDVGQNLPEGDHDLIMFHDEYIITKTTGDIYRSLIDQDEWEILYSWPNDFERFLDYISLDSVLFITTWDGILYSTDNGKTIEDYSDNLKGKIIGTIEYFNDSLFVEAGGKAVWKKDVDFENLLSTSTELSSEIDFTVYPNPASEWIFIESDFVEDIEVDLFDVLGNRIKTSTVHSGALGIGDLHSGTYFLKFHLREDVIIKKMIIQK